MNTRGRKLVPQPHVPSVVWHLMHEEYHPIFAAEHCERVECWYNKTATGRQRETFRRICQAMYCQRPDRADPDYEAEYTRQCALCEARVMLKNYGAVLSDLGRRLARVWILHEASARDKDSFREVFTGAQSSFVPVSVMKAEYTPPDEDVYDGIDRSNFLCSVDWSNLEAQEKRSQVHRQRFDGRRISLHRDHPRVTKPKNQFDGISPLAALGYTGANEDEAMEKLRKKLEDTADSDNYYTVDGCTVYIAGKSKKANPSTLNSTKHGVISTLCGD